MTARYLKTEEKAIRTLYPTSPKEEILKAVPNRNWDQIGVYARRKGIHRTTEARGNSIRDGRKKLKHWWSDQDNILIDKMYPSATHVELRAAFPNRSLIAIKVHAQKRHLHRTREAKGRQIIMGREIE